VGFTFAHMYRLAPRGGAGLACDQDGVALGAAVLARVRRDNEGKRHCEVSPPHRVRKVLRAAYGSQPEAEIQRLYRGLKRTAAWLEAGDMARAGIEAVYLAVPDLTDEAMAKLALLADLEKGAAWEDEDRIPAGETGGGEWTAGDAGAAIAQTEPAARPIATPPTVHLDDGVYRPGLDHPFLIATGGPPEEEVEPPRLPRRGSNGPPTDYTILMEAVPFLKEYPFLAAPFAPVDHLIGYSELWDAANAAATLVSHDHLMAQIKALNPRFNVEELFPVGGIPAMSVEARDNMLMNLSMEYASTLYRVRGDVEPLQATTLSFLQNAVNAAYAEGVKEWNAGRLKPSLSREVAIGNYIDGIVRRKLQDFFDMYQVTYGKGKNITINNRNYNTSSTPPTYRLPDARVADLAYDWTLELKSEKDGQVIGILRADAAPKGLIIIQPNVPGQYHTYYIPRSILLQLKKVNYAAYLQASHSR
jgi:hypothetical protein